VVEEGREGRTCLLWGARCLHQNALLRLEDMEEDMGLEGPVHSNAFYGPQ
jgi:hypothetical protein